MQGLKVQGLKAFKKGANGHPYKAHLDKVIEIPHDIRMKSFPDSRVKAQTV